MSEIVSNKQEKITIILVAAIAEFLTSYYYNIWIYSSVHFLQKEENRIDMKIVTTGTIFVYFPALY